MRSGQRGIGAHYWVWVALFALGCGAERVQSSPASEQAPQPMAPAPGTMSEGREQEEYQSLADAERALDQAKAELDRVAMLEPQPAPPSAPAAGAAPAPEPAPSRKPGDDAKKAEQAPQGLSGAGPSDCNNACRAFASLSRAADAVCRLEVPAAERCERARRIVSSAEQRVASCACR